MGVMDQMGRDSVVQAIGALVARSCGGKPPDLRPDDRLSDIPGMDSLRLLQVVASLEEWFQIEIDVDALECLYHVRDLIDMVSNAKPLT